MRLIDADAFLERLSHTDRFFGVVFDINDVRTIIAEMPTADVTQARRGRWIEEDGIQICSECGEEHEWEDYRAPYCDTCGAKMDLEEEHG